MASLPSALVQEGRLLEPATGGRFVIKLQPLLENRRVDAAEVRTRVQVALNQLFRLEGGIFAVVTAFDVVGVVVLAEVRHEGLETLAYGAPQLSVAGVLAGVGVEATVITVEDPATQIGEVYLGDPALLSGDRGIG